MKQNTSITIFTCMQVGYVSKNPEVWILESIQEPVYKIKKEHFGCLHDPLTHPRLF